MRTLIPRTLPHYRPCHEYIARQVLLLLLSLALILPGFAIAAAPDKGRNAARSPDSEASAALTLSAGNDWLAALPPADAAVASALADHLNGQWAVINRDESARAALEYETLALAKAGDAKTDRETYLAGAKAQLDTARDALTSAQTIQANLSAVRSALTHRDAADRAHALAVKSEEAASAALDKAENDLSAAQAILEEADDEHAEQSTAYEAAETRLAALKDLVAATTDEAALTTAKADLTEAERSITAFKAQLAGISDRASRAAETAVDAKSRYDKAFAAEQSAIARIEETRAALAQAQTAYDALQAVDGDLTAHEEDARLAVLRAEASLEAAETLTAQSTEALADAVSSLDEATARHAAAIAEAETAAADLAELRAKWQTYSLCLGAVQPTYPMPAMDLLAQAEAAPGLYAAYINSTRLYLFKPGAGNQPFLTTVLNENKLSIELTRNGNGTLSVRYISSDGRTHLQSMGADASTLVTGQIPVLIVDSQLRGMTQYLGEASAVNTTSMHGLTTLVQFGIDEPIRHKARPQ